MFKKFGTIEFDILIIQKIENRSYFLINNKAKYKKNKINWKTIDKDSYVLRFEALASPSQRTGKNDNCEKSVINHVILEYILKNMQRIKYIGI